MTTYTDVDANSIDTVEVYSDSGLTALVETLTVGSGGTGIYVATAPLTYASYSLGTLYYLKITYTPTSGGTQRYQSFPLYLFPQGQAAGAAAVTGTDCDGAYLEAPTLSVRVGAGDFRNSGLENATYASQHRFLQVLSLPTGRTAVDLHLVIGAGRAGAPILLEKILWEARGKYVEAVGSPNEIPAPTLYRSNAAGGGVLLRRSRNFTFHADVPRGRPGYKIQRQISTASAIYLKRVICDQSNGTMRAGIMLGGTGYEDGSSPTSRDATMTNPYATATTTVPQFAHLRGKTVMVGAEFRAWFHSGSALSINAALTDPGTPTLTGQTSGSPGMTLQEWFVRVRWYDSTTGIYSGPSQRTATAASTTLSGATNAIKVQPGTAPSRATHWQVQFGALDTPSSYEISYDAKDALGGTLFSATGLIPVGNTEAYFEDDPTSGDRFPFRSVAGVVVYRHTNPPTGAAHVASHNGRACYASNTDTWLVMSEASDPEYFYNDPTSPHSGFNTLRGEGLNDAVVTPCTALASTKSELLYFQRSSINVLEGSFLLAVDSNGNAALQGRDLRNRPLTENSLGAISPHTCTVDNAVFFFSQDGPAVYISGLAQPLDPESIMQDWGCRDPVYETRYTVGYSPKHRLVLFSFVDQNANVAGVPNVVLAYSLRKQVWCPPWDLEATSFTIHRVTDIDSAATLGTQLCFGGPYGSMNQFGYGYGDGEDGSDADAADLTSTSDTATTVTVSTASWTDNEWRGISACLTDRGTGQRYYKTVKSNTGTVITWDGNLNDSGSGWIINLGGFPQQVHVNVSSPGAPIMLSELKVQLQDALGVES